jgi:hypothetical protein
MFNMISIKCRGKHDAKQVREQTQIIGNLTKEEQKKALSPSKTDSDAIAYI